MPPHHEKEEHRMLGGVSSKVLILQEIANWVRTDSKKGGMANNGTGISDGSNSTDRFDEERVYGHRFG